MTDAIEENDSTKEELAAARAIIEKLNSDLESARLEIENLKTNLEQTDASLAQANEILQPWIRRAQEAEEKQIQLESQVTSLNAALDEWNAHAGDGHTH